MQKRFIAGAICPHCGLMDKTVIYTKNNQEFAECVRCGHLQQQTTAKQAPSAPQLQKITVSIPKTVSSKNRS